MFYVGLDLGQAQGFSALTIFEQIQEQGTRYKGVQLYRFPLGTSYPAIVEAVRDIMAMPALGRHAKLVVDATGVGAPVVDLLRTARLDPVAITITFGTQVNCTPEGGYHVPKRDLVTNLQVLLQAGRVAFAQDLTEVPTLIRELTNFQVKISQEGNETFANARESAHDDLVLASCLPTWYAEKVDGLFWCIPMARQSSGRLF